ncbi:hypothetical protein [Rubrobacter calidifluminis]|uniref:hypothetical protein n=1 Tax=Rubrobacter calidifluminis TaxID=1392640 RepID=UPI00235F0FA6|nr:hypothetical protein [Rubrobacter calidifluminis]
MEEYRGLEEVPMDRRGFFKYLVYTLLAGLGFIGVSAAFPKQAFAAGITCYPASNCSSGNNCSGGKHRFHCYNNCSGGAFYTCVNHSCSTFVTPC